MRIVIKGNVWNLKSQNGYTFGNEWYKGPYHGDSNYFTYEWDVVLSEQGKKVWGKYASKKNGNSL